MAQASWVAWAVSGLHVPAGLPESLEEESRRDVPGHDEADMVVLDVPSNAPDVALRGDLAAAIQHWAGVYGVSAALMDCLAWRESTYGQNPNAFNGVSGHATAFQFNIGTWAGTPPGQRGVDPWQASHWEAAEATAWMLAQGRRAEWPTASGCP